MRRYSYFEATIGRVWVEDHATIIHHYLTGWFALDLVSTLVSAFDIIALALDETAAAAAVSGGSRLGNSSAAADGDAPTAEAEAADAMKGLKMLKCIRALRLVKLLRLLRGSRIFRRYETMSIRHPTCSL